MVIKDSSITGTKVGAYPAAMTRLQELNKDTIYSVRKLFTHLIKTVFYHKYQLPCPKYLSGVRDLTFLPKLIGTSCLWRELQLSLVADLLSVTLDRFYALISNPQLLQTEQQECYTAGQLLVEYRLSVQQDLPTRLKHVYSWNLNSWKTPDPSSDDPKTRRCRRLLRTGPVCACKRPNAMRGSLRDLLDTSLGDGLNRSSLPTGINTIHDDPCDLDTFTSQHLALAASFWSLWRTQEVPKANPAVAPHLLARKYLKGTHQWVNIPSWIVEALNKHSRGAVIQSVEHLPVVQGACSIPKVVLQDCFDVIDTLQENVSYVP